MATLQEMRKKVKESDLTLITKFINGEQLSEDELDKVTVMGLEKPESILVAAEGDEAKIDSVWDLFQSPPMIARAEALRKSGKIQQGLETAVDLFNDSYNLYLSSEQKRVGEEELSKVQQAKVPSKVQAIPELEDALRQARELGDPRAAISQLTQGVERANLGAIRAAQLGSRGQAGGLGAQAQAIHQSNLSQLGQIPMMGEQIKREGLQAQIPLIAQKQQIEEQNRRADVALYPTQVEKQLLEEQMAGRTIAMGREGQANTLQGLASKVPGLAGNLYSQQYSHLPPDVAPFVGNLDYGLNF